MKLRDLKQIGPGIMIAATGVGAGDLIAAAVAGTKFGTSLMWAAVLGALLKYTVNEGLARWQLATGSTLAEGWINHLPKWINYYFLAYLMLWSFVVAGALMGATGIAANSLLPFFSVGEWGAAHSITALVLVGLANYHWLEQVMKGLIVIMVVITFGCAIQLLPEANISITHFIYPTLPENSLLFVLGIIGGVGGSVTLLSYGYWIREKQWLNQDDLTLSRIDLSVGYLLTALFGIAIIIVASAANPEMAKGTGIILALASKLGSVMGDTAKWIFLTGVWAAMFSSMIGVWNGIPYIFSDLMKHQIIKNKLTPKQSYHYFLCFLAIPPLVLLLADRPIWLIIIYAVTAAFFMPFLAATLLYLNNRKLSVKQLKNGIITNLLLISALLLFLFLFGKKVADYF